MCGPIGIWMLRGCCVTARFQAAPTVPNVSRTRKPKHSFNRLGISMLRRGDQDTGKNESSKSFRKERLRCSCREICRIASGQRIARQKRCCARLFRGQGGAPLSSRRIQRAIQFPRWKLCIGCWKRGMIYCRPTPIFTTFWRHVAQPCRLVLRCVWKGSCIGALRSCLVSVIFIITWKRCTMWRVSPRRLSVHLRAKAGTRSTCIGISTKIACRWTRRILTSKYCSGSHPSGLTRSALE